MAILTKATITIDTSYAAAAAETVTKESWGRVGLWDIRPWLPWDSRGLISLGGWQDYLYRTAVMDSSQAPDYVPADQGPKSWDRQTNTVVIYDTSLIPPFAACALVGSGPYSYAGPHGGTPVGNVAFDVSSTLINFLNTLCLCAYASNSYTPALGGPTETDSLEFFQAYLDLVFDDGGTGRFFPVSVTVIPGGDNLGTPTDVLDQCNAIDGDPDTGAIVEETNANNGGFSALWHPEVLLINGWCGGVGRTGGTGNSFY